MDEVILRVLKGEASPFEEERLRRWRSEAAGNEAHFRELSRIWELSAEGSGSQAFREAEEGEVDALLSSILSAAEERRGATALPIDDGGPRLLGSFAARANGKGIASQARRGAHDGWLAGTRARIGTYFGIRP